MNGHRHHKRQSAAETEETIRRHREDTGKTPGVDGISSRVLADLADENSMDLCEADHV